MKKNTISTYFLFLPICLLILITAFCGCNNAGNTLFDSASPDNSALVIYKYGYINDGSNALGGTQYTMYDSVTEKELLAKLSSLSLKEVQDWSTDKIEFPLYGMWCSTADGESLNIAWTGNYLITEDGKTFECDFNIEDLITGYEWRDVDSFTHATFFPCSRILSLDESDWIPTLLREVTDLTAPEGIEMSLVKRDGTKFTVQLANHTEEEWCYGTYFSVKTNIDGIWYDIPTMPGNWAFTDIAMILMPGGSMERTYDISMYGDLPAGAYALEVEGMIITFTE